MAIFPSQACQNKSACKAASPSMDFIGGKATASGGTLGKKKLVFFEILKVFLSKFSLLSGYSVMFLNHFDYKKPVKPSWRWPG